MIRSKNLIKKFKKRLFVLVLQLRDGYYRLTLLKFAIRTNSIFKANLNQVELFNSQKSDGK